MKYIFEKHSSNHFLDDTKILVYILLSTLFLFLCLYQASLCLPPPEHSIFLSLPLCLCLCVSQSLPLSFCLSVSLRPVLCMSHIASLPQDSVVLFLEHTLTRTEMRTMHTNARTHYHTRHFLSLELKIAWPAYATQHCSSSPSLPLNNSD